MATTAITQKQGKAAAKREARRRVRERASAAQLTTAGAALGGAGVWALLETKFSRIASLDEGGKIPTAPIVAIAGLLTGMAQGSPLLYGAGLGIGAKWVGDWTEQQTWAQEAPSA